MFNQPYDTTVCSGYQHSNKDIIAGLSKSIAMGELVEAKTLKGANVQGVFTVPSYVKAYGPFFHPIAFDYIGRKIIAIDTRAYLKQQMGTGEARVVVPNEYSFLLNRAILMKEWTQGSRAEMLRAADLPAQVFMRWIPEAIVRRLGLSPEHQATLVILAGYFFFSQFGEQIEAQALSQRISRLSRIPFQMVYDLISRIDGGDREVTAEQFVTWVREHVQSPRTEHFNIGLLYASVNTAWYGAAGREISGVAVEYPPYLFAMIYAGLIDRSYRNTPLNKLVEQLDKQGVGKRFLMSIATLISELTHV